VIVECRVSARHRQASAGPDKDRRRGCADRGE
jgi:hypothetical protein